MPEVHSHGPDGLPTYPDQADVDAGRSAIPDAPLTPDVPELPATTLADAGKALTVNEAGDGYELATPSGGSVPYGDFLDYANWTGLSLPVTGDGVALAASNYLPGDGSSAGSSIPAMVTNGSIPLTEGLYRVNWFLEAHTTAPPDAGAQPVLDGGVTTLGSGMRRIHTGPLRNDLPDGTKTDFVTSDEYLMAVPAAGLTFGPLGLANPLALADLVLDYADFSVTRVA